MAVVSTKSNLFRDAHAGDPVVDPKALRGRLEVATGTVLNAATDSSGSKYHLIDLPSNCLLHSGTAFDVQNWGFAQVNIGTASDIDALGTVAQASGNTYSPVVFGDAKHGLPLWQVLGLAADPGGWIGIYAHASANATGAGNMPFTFQTVTVT